MYCVAQRGQASLPSRAGGDGIVSQHQALQHDAQPQSLSKVQQTLGRDPTAGKIQAHWQGLPGKEVSNLQNTFVADARMSKDQGG
eukprot:CAMPEP_0115105744 /NCGR_PEP_ID=MMETSP0227-20121206/36194_1 /TAXON_ID=89957 /ORGANISM="Polarella glacialis, Strain CCMP 1383" /LENGTH=84 /DNA_ID=CAMNT_0002503113 /DNA_START=243 /DNA_END=498 /DNA_ORIENTATION=+